jgi:hypothetical protein
MTGSRDVPHQDEQDLRVVEQMTVTLRRATQRFAEGASAEESLARANEAMSIGVEVPIDLFLRMSPQSMVALLEVTSTEDDAIRKIAEALLLQSDVYRAQGLLIEAGVRQEQAAAMLDFIDPERAN